EPRSRGRASARAITRRNPSTTLFSSDAPSRAGDAKSRPRRPTRPSCQCGQSRLRHENPDRAGLAEVAAEAEGGRNRLEPRLLLPLRDIRARVTLSVQLIFEDPGDAVQAGPPRRARLIVQGAAIADGNNFVDR